jgi:hypothetical protein
MTKFERDKAYKMCGDGSEWTVIATDVPGPYGPIAAVSKSGNIWRFRKDGRCTGYVGESGDYDLMLPKPEPVVEWGTIGPSNTFEMWSSEEVARAWLKSVRSDGPYRLAKRVTTLED